MKKSFIVALALSMMGCGLVESGCTARGHGLCSG